MTCVSVISLTGWLMLRTVSLTMLYYLKLLKLLSHNLINFVRCGHRGICLSSLFHYVYVCTRLPTEAGDGQFACARGERRRPAMTFARRSPALPEVIRRNGALVLSRTHPVLTSPASPALPAVFSMTRINKVFC